MAKEMKKKSPFLLNACFITPYPFCRFGSLHTATDGGGSMQQRRFCTAKTRVQELTRTSILGHSHTKPKKVEAVIAAVGEVDVPITDDAVLRVIVPATAAYDAVITGCSTLLMSLPFFSQKIFEPHRSTMYVLVHC